MERTRVAALAALFVVLSVVGVAFAAGTSLAPSPLGAVPWPVSTLLVSEVQTGGASASDEFAEITNVGPGAVDLAGLELVYATSTGSTVTRKASWSTSLLLEPGRHLFIANVSGVYAGLADATYSGGFAATGGAVVLRAIGGTPVDAVGWGDATNTFVEGSPMTAPAAGSSIERKPGGTSGNTVDTNDNAVDFFAQSAPNPQSLAAPPVPAPGPSATPSPTVTPTILPTPTAAPTDTPLPTDAPTPPPSATATIGPTPTIEPTPAPTPTPELTPEPSLSPTQEPTATPEPTLMPSATPTNTSDPTATPSPTGSPAPSPTAPPTLLSIGDARSQPDDSSVTVVGVLTTQLGALEAGRKAFVQDETAGIAVYLDAAVLDGLPSDTLVRISGTIDDRFAERTLRASIADVVAIGEQQRPAPWFQHTGEIAEGIEGTRVLVQGVTVGPPSDMADGLGLMVDDGTGQVRVIVGPRALGGATVPAGTSVVAVGPVGQRDSSGTGLGGYRIHVTEEGDFEVLPTPTPSPSLEPTPVPTAPPSPSPTSTAAPSLTPAPTSQPTPNPTATPAPTPTPSPTATPGATPPPVIDIVEARGAPVGTVVTVAGVVTAEAGRLGLPPSIAIADGTGGIAVRLPEGVAAPVRGATVLVRGALADPYGQLELRPSSGGFRVTGSGSLPAPMRLTAAQLGESTEGRLAEIVGTVTAPPRKSTSGDISVDLVDPAGTSFRVVADGSSGIETGDLLKDRSYRLTGIVGQRASRKGALDGYRLYLRDRADIVVVAARAGPGASPSPGATGGGATIVPVSRALAVPDGTIVTIEATVTADATLLDASGRRIVVQDRTGAIETLLPVGASAPSIGSRVRITGETGLAWGAHRIRATHLSRLNGGAGIQPLIIHRAPAERDEWLLVRLSGTIDKVNRIGERWRAEVRLADGTAVLVQGQSGAGIPSAAIVAGRRITVTGIVRRPYPTASDRRFAILPRGRGDVAVSGGGAAGGSDAQGPDDHAPGGSVASGGTTAGTAATEAVTPDTDLATLGEVVGQRVKVGGLIVRVSDDGFDLDDGTALARILLRGDMAAMLSQLREREAVAASGVVELVDGVPVVVVGADGSLVRVGALGQALPIASEGPRESAGAGTGPRAADSATGFGGVATPTSFLALIVLTAVSILATVVRRRLSQRRLRLAVVARLAALRPGATSGTSAAEHESA